MLTKEEYKKEYIRMMDSLRDKNIGMPNCDGVECDICPFDKNVCKPFSATNARFLAFETIEIVEKWSEEHPIVTMGDKFKEVFGVEPKDRDGDYVCPTTCGFMIKEKCGPLYAINCSDCSKEFWNSEYVAPEKSEKE